MLGNIKWGNNILGGEE